MRIEGLIEKCDVNTSDVDEVVVVDLEVVVSISSEEESDSGSKANVEVDASAETEVAGASASASTAFSDFLLFLLFFSAFPELASASLIVLPLGPITPPKMTPFFFFFGGSPSAPLEDELPFASTVAG